MSKLNAITLNTLKIFGVLLCVAILYVAIAVIWTYDASDGTGFGDVYFWLQLDHVAEWFFGFFKP